MNWIKINFPESIGWVKPFTKPVSRIRYNNMRWWNMRYYKDFRDSLIRYTEHEQNTTN